MDDPAIASSNSRRRASCARTPAKTVNISPYTVLSRPEKASTASWRR